MVTLHILGKQDKVVGAALFLVLGEEAVVVGGDVHLGADDGLYVGKLLRILEELLHAVHIAVVGNGKSHLPVLVRLLEKLRDGGRTIEDGVLRVDVKMYERHRFKGSLFCRLS